MATAPNFPKTVLTDTGFWYALYEPRDQFHLRAKQRADLLETNNIIVPWPCLYESFNTRFAKNKDAVVAFERVLKRPHVVLLSDVKYREAALEAAFLSTRCFALVDMVIRLMLEDVDIRKNALLTFNHGDFSDVCRKYQIEMF